MPRPTEGRLISRAMIMPSTSSAATETPATSPVTLSALYQASSLRTVHVVVQPDERARGVLEPQAEPEQAVPDRPGQRDDGDQEDGQDRGRGQQQPEPSVGALLRAPPCPGAQQASYRRSSRQLALSPSPSSRPHPRRCSLAFFMIVAHLVGHLLDRLLGRDLLRHRLPEGRLDRIGGHLRVERGHRARLQDLERCLRRLRVRVLLLDVRVVEDGHAGRAGSRRRGSASAGGPGW